MAQESAGRAHRPVGRQEGSSDGGVHEDDVLVLGGVHLPAGQGPAEGAPVVALVLVVDILGVAGQLRQAAGLKQAVALQQRRLSASRPRSAELQCACHGTGNCFGTGPF